MADPRGYEGVLSSIDQYALALGHGVMTGMQQRQQREMQQRSQQFAADQAQAGRDYQSANLRASRALDLTSRGYDAGPLDAQSQEIVGPLMPGAARQGQDAAFGRAFQAGRQSDPLALPPSDAQRWQDTVIGMQPGNGITNVPSPGPGGMPAPSRDEVVRPRAEALATQYGVAPDRVDALGAGIRTAVPKPGPIPKPIDYRATKEGVDATNAAKIAAAKARPRPLGSGGMAKDRLPEAVKLARDAEATDRKDLSDMDRTVIAQTRLNLQGPAYINPTPEQRKKAEADAKRDRIPQLASRAGMDVEGLDRATDDEVISTYKRLRSVPFNREAKTQEILSQFGAIEKALGPAPQPQPRGPNPQSINQRIQRDWGTDAAPGPRKYGVNPANTLATINGNFSEAEKASARARWAEAVRAAAADETGGQ